MNNNTLPESILTRDELDAAAELLIEKLPRFIELTGEFIDEVLPQAGRLCFQRYDHINEMCTLLSEFKKELA